MVSTNDPGKFIDEWQKSRIGPTTRMQCKVCGFIYDPAEGCVEWQADPGTPFAEIPEILDCPACGCPHSGFLVLRDGEEG